MLVGAMTREAYTNFPAMRNVVFAGEWHGLPAHVSIGTMPMPHGCIDFPASNLSAQR
jgi:hypothetical protein